MYKIVYTNRMKKDAKLMHFYGIEDKRTMEKHILWLKHLLWNTL